MGCGLRLRLRITLRANPGDEVKRTEEPTRAERRLARVKTVVWTDGSCNANGMHGRGGWAALIDQAGDGP
jgi:hypothetical protein